MGMTLPSLSGLSADSADSVLLAIANAGNEPRGYTAADKLREIAQNERLRGADECVCFYRNVE